MAILREYLIASQVEDAFRKVLPLGFEIINEFQTRGSRRVDFVIVRGFEILACIEVKSDLSSPSRLDSAQKQVALYQEDTHSYWAIVTDSKCYYVHSLADEDGFFIEKKNAEDVCQLILGIQHEKGQTDSSHIEDSNLEQLRHQFLQICKKYAKISTIDSVEKVLKDVSSENCKITPTRFTFTRSFENRLFQALLGTYKEDEVVRYIPFASIYRSLNEQTIGMVSLVGMNDVSECYYADQYLARKKGDDKDKSSMSILPAENGLLNNTYILSCNHLDKIDNLTMWRLYGDNCKGVCIKLFIEKDRLDQDNSFVLAPVSYGLAKDNHPELDFANDILSLKIGSRNLTFETWCYWKHFFKDHRYLVEKEVRLLYTGGGCGKRSWILVAGNEIPCTISLFPVKTLPNHSNGFPLTLSGVMIGSKCIDIETKKRQFEELIKERNAGYDKGFAQVTTSEIDNYR